MRNHDEFREELLRRKSEFDTRRQRRGRILTRCLCAAVCLVLIVSFALRPTPVNAEDLLEGYTPGAVTGKAPDDAFTAAQLDLAVKLLQGSYAGENTLISPLSATLALSMTANGAGGNTLTQMEEVLCGGMDIGEWNEYLKYYVNSLPSTSKVKLHQANSVWYEDSPFLAIRPQFLQTVADYYHAQLYAAPFDDDTVNEINKWISQNTDGMIDRALEKLDGVMYLINALVFDGKWETPYEENDIREHTFRTADGTTQTVDMMFSQESLYLESDSATGFMKDYAGGHYRFVAVLPREGLTLTEYLEALTPEELQDLLNGAAHKTVDAGLPQFEYECSFELSETLRALGMSDAFDPDIADFSAMANDLYIGSVLQKTRITVDPNGTKAAAITIVTMVPTGMPLPNTSVILDRPFLYMIVDTQTNLPLFLGAVTDLG